jgi:hypothetical protein
MGNSNQRSRIVSSDNDPNAFFIHAAETEEVWDIPNGSAADGERVQLFAFNGNDNQKWQMQPAEGPDNVFKILSIASNLVLDVPGFSQLDGGIFSALAFWCGFFHQPAFHAYAGVRVILSICVGDPSQWIQQAANDSRAPDRNLSRTPGTIRRQAALCDHNHSCSCTSAGANGRSRDRPGHYRGPLHGIPWGAKDLLDTAHIPTTYGAEFFRNRIPAQDAIVVQRLDQKRLESEVIQQ